MIKRGVVILAFMVLVSAELLPQIPGGAETGFPLNGVFLGSDFDSVQINNGNLHIAIPIWSEPKGRGTPTELKYVYDNKSWQIDYWYDDALGGFHAAVRDGRHWSLFNPYPYFRSVSSTGDYNYTYDTVDDHCEYYAYGFEQMDVYQWYKNYVLEEPDGTKHHFAPGALLYAPNGVCGQQPPGLMADTHTTLYADDGSGWVMKIDPLHGLATDIIRKDGLHISKDSNGNYNNAVGRTIRSDSYYDSDGVLRSVPTTTTLVYIRTHLCPFAFIPSVVGPDGKVQNTGILDCTEFEGQEDVLNDVTLPNGLKYTINYGSADPNNPTDYYYGEPLSIDLPGGARVAWTWADGDSAGRIVKSRTITVDGVNATWTYEGVSGDGAYEAGVIDPAGNETEVECNGVTSVSPTTGGITVYGGPACLIGTTRYYEGNGGARKLIKTTKTEYDSWLGTSNDCTGQLYLPRSEVTTWNETGLVRKTDTALDHAAYYSENTGCVPMSWRNAQSVLEYDWGNWAPGSLLRRTDYTYRHTDNSDGFASNYSSLNIADLVTSKTVYDGSGNQVEKTTYGYDESPIESTSGSATAHDYTNYGPSFRWRGNLTSTTRWLKSGQSWSPMSATRNTYDDLGNLKSTMDPEGHQTKFDYSDNYVSDAGQCGSGNSYSYVTTTTNAKNQSTTNKYYRCTGLLQSTTDLNGPPTTYHYDLMGLKDTTVYPDTGVVRVCPNSSAVTDGPCSTTYSLPLTLTQTQKVDSNGTTVVSQRVFDGLGRLSTTELKSDSDGPTFTRIEYDLLGRKAKVWNTTRCDLRIAPSDTCPGERSSGVTRFLYDAVSRPFMEIKPDGSIVKTDYSGYSGGVGDPPRLVTTVADEAGRQKRSYTDGLGRVTRVDEPAASDNQ